MGYFLRAFIAKSENLRLIIKAYTKANLVELEQGISMILMTEELYDEINQMTPSPGVFRFELFSDHVEKQILSKINEAKVAYVESEFFGGQGGHLGVVWENGKRVFVGDFNKGSLNKVLKLLGVKKKQFKDEFDTVGLGKHRNIEDWMQEI